jgi:hypothetical protein
MDGRHGRWDDGREAWDRLARARDDGAALEALDDVGMLRRLLDQAELDAVRAARRSGKSWAEIATRLGVTRQSAWERWRDLDEAPAESGPSVVTSGPLSGMSEVAEEVVGRAARDLRRRSSVTVPNVVGLTHGEAQDVLLNLGLLAVGPDPDAPPVFGGTVTDQSPEAGAKVPRGTAVTLWVERGGGSGVREPRRPKPGPKHFVERVPEPTTDQGAVG